MHRIIYILLASCLLLFYQCQTENSIDGKETIEQETPTINYKKHAVTLNPKLPDDSIKNLIYFIDQDQELNRDYSFEDISNNPSIWIQLSLTKEGFVVFDPCNGSIPFYEIRHDSLIENGRIETNRWLIKKFNKINSKEYEILCGTRETGVIALIKIVNSESMLAIITRTIKNNGKVLMIENAVVIPEEMEYKFGHIKDPCPNSFEVGINFIEINFDSLNRSVELMKYK